MSTYRTNRYQHDNMSYRQRQSSYQTSGGYHGGEGNDPHRPYNNDRAPKGHYLEGRSVQEKIGSMIRIARAAKILPDIAVRHPIVDGDFFLNTSAERPTFENAGACCPRWEDSDEHNWRDAFACTNACCWCGKSNHIGRKCTLAHVLDWADANGHKGLDNEQKGDLDTGAPVRLPLMEYHMPDVPSHVVRSKYGGKLPGKRGKYPFREDDDRAPSVGSSYANRNSSQIGSRAPSKVPSHDCRRSASPPREDRTHPVRQRTPEPATNLDAGESEACLDVFKLWEKGRATYLQHVVSALQWARSEGVVLQMAAQLRKMNHNLVKAMAQNRPSEAAREVERLRQENVQLRAQATAQAAAQGSGSGDDIDMKEATDANGGNQGDPASNNAQQVPPPSKGSAAKSRSRNQSSISKLTSISSARIQDRQLRTVGRGSPVIHRSEVFMSNNTVG